MKINNYIQLVENNNLSVRELRKRIKSKEYERLPESTKNKLINNNELNIKDTIPEPIIIPIKDNLKDEINEKYLQSIIVNNISSFIEQLGDGFSFIKNEYKLKIGNNYNYIDILLFNYINNSFVVVELKNTPLKKAAGNFPEGETCLTFVCVFSWIWNVLSWMENKNQKQLNL